MKRILITGASGFTGRWLVKEAIERGYEVWAGIRKSSSLKYLDNNMIKLVFLNYDDVNILTEQLKEIVTSVDSPEKSEHSDKNHICFWDFIIHNAGITKTLNKKDFFRINSLYTNNFIEALIKSGSCPKKFLLMSSLSVFGPVKDESNETLQEDDNPQPNSNYGKSKLKAEMTLSKSSGFSYIIFRTTGVYGPGDKDYLLQINSVKQGFNFQIGFKPQKLTFIYVKDLARVALDALENTNINNSTFIITDGEVYNSDDFVSAILDLTGKKHVIKITVPIWICFIICKLLDLFGRIVNTPQTLNSDKYHILRQRNWSCDTKKMNNELNFHPQYDLKKGLKETLFFNEEIK